MEVLVSTLDGLFIPSIFLGSCHQLFVGLFRSDDIFSFFVINYSFCQVFIFYGSCNGLPYSVWAMEGFLWVLGDIQMI